MGVFRLRPVENRRMGYTATEDLWEDTMWEPESRQGGGSMNRGTATSRSDQHPVNLILDRMDEMESKLEKKMDEMQGQMGEAGSADMLTAKIEDLVEEAIEVAKKPPETWKQYLEKKDFAGIVEMESGELKKALSSKDKKAAHKEVVHTLAALLRAGV